MVITVIAIVLVLLCAMDVIHLSDGLVAVAIIVGAVFLILGFISQMGKDEAAYRKARNYWQSR